MSLEINNLIEEARQAAANVDARIRDNVRLGTAVAESKAIIASRESGPLATELRSIDEDVARLRANLSELERKLRDVTAEVRTAEGRIGAIEKHIR